MSTVNSIGFALDPNNVPAFLLDWEMTLRCNLDCSYCPTEYHDNTTEHPPLEECLKSIDFMYEYVDEYMKYKKPTQRKVVLNVYGGESVFHPDIVEILRECHSRYESYSDKWHLTITCTTNAIVGRNRWREIVPFIDEFTVSYHSENLPKQKQQFFDNMLYLKEQDKRFKCVVMMHNDADLFADAETAVEFCKQHNIKYMPKPLDMIEGSTSFYSSEQFAKLKTFWINQVATPQRLEYKKKIDLLGQNNQIRSIDEGRACCGGRGLSLNGDLKSKVSFVPRQGFEGWSCSVNWFFLYVQQLGGNVYTNKDCRMSTTGRVEPLGNINNTDQILSNLRTQFETSTMPVIECKKKICYCGICAPKAESKIDFMDLIKRHVPIDVFQKTC